MTRLKAIATAYACEPWQGSEPGIGWNIVREVARYHDLTVVTRPNNKPAIEKFLAEEPVPGLSFVYYDPPKWATWWKKGTRGLFAYYYWWQLGAARIVKKLSASGDFDLVHHVTFGRYWSPSFIYRSGLPVVWGPVGGGESTPPTLMATLPSKGRLYERARLLLRRLGEMDPFVRKMTRSADAILATTDESKERIAALGGRNIAILGNAALDESEIAKLNNLPHNETGSLRFLSVGRILHWKGFHLGLQAFAEADIPGSEYWIVGNGPAEDHLNQLAQDLGIADRVRFTGKIDRSESLAIIADSDALVHPSFHDSGGWVCIEALSAGKPVISLNIGGPALMVDTNTGWKIEPQSGAQVIQDVARAMKKLADADVRQKMSDAARDRSQSFSWSHKGRSIAGTYASVASRCVEERPTESAQQVESLVN